MENNINIWLLIIMPIFFQGCVTPASVSTTDKTGQDLRDVFILTILAREYLINSNELDYTLEKLIESDTLNRVAKNFEKIQFITRGGHVAIRYKFSNKRDIKIDFVNNEDQLIPNWRVIEKRLNGDFDGEIQLEYNERFYRFRKVIINKPESTVANNSYTP